MRLYIGAAPWSCSRASCRCGPYTADFRWSRSTRRPSTETAGDPHRRVRSPESAARLERLLPRMMSEDPRVRPSFSALLRELG